MSPLRAALITTLVIPLGIVGAVVFLACVLLAWPVLPFVVYQMRKIELDIEAREWRHPHRNPEEYYE